MFFSRKLEMSSSAGNLTSPMIRLFLVAHGPLTEGNVTTFVGVLLKSCSSNVRVCILITWILTEGSMSKYCTDFKCCRSDQFPLLFLHPNGVTQMSTNAPVQCFASHHMWSLASIPEMVEEFYVNKVCWHRTAIQHSQKPVVRAVVFTIVNHCWTMGHMSIWCGLYKKSVQQMHIGRVMICLTSFPFAYLLYTGHERC
jgi:hypothetical protein